LAGKAGGITTVANSGVQACPLQRDMAMEKFYWLIYYHEEKVFISKRREFMPDHSAGSSPTYDCAWLLAGSPSL